MSDEAAIDPDEWRRIVTEHEILWSEVKPLTNKIAADVVETNELIVDLVDDLYGEKKPTPADPNNRVGGRLERLGNGGVKIKLPAALWAFLGTVTAASIAGLVTLIVTFSG